MRTPRVLLIGLPGAAWSDLHPLIDAGRLPTIGRLVDDGTIAKLDVTALVPAAVWASLATGTVSAVHTIVHPLTVRPDGGGVEPVGADDWGAQPLWRVLADHGIECVTLGWPGLTPADAWSGAVVDERFDQVTGDAEHDWPLAPRCIHPLGLRDALRDLRVHPDDLDPADCRGIAPAALARAATWQAAAAFFATRDDWRVLSAFQPLLAFDRSEEAAGFVDASLGRLVYLAGPDCDVMLVSDRGVAIAAGPGFARDATVHHATPADIGATILARFGLAVSGSGARSLLAGTTDEPTVLSIDTRRPTRRPPPATPPPAAAAPLVAAVRRASALHAATAALAAGDYDRSAGIAEAMLGEDPTDDDARGLLGQCRFLQGDFAACGAIGAALLRTRANEPWGAMMVGASLALAGRAVEATLHLSQAARLAGTNPDAHVRLGAIALHTGQVAEAARHYADALRLSPESTDAHAGLGLAALAAGNVAAGEGWLRAALGRRYHAPALHHQLGLLYASQGRFDEAQAALHIALSQNPEQAGATALLDLVREATA